MVDRILEKEQGEEESKKWELKLNKDDVKVYIKKGGSEYSADHPYIRTEVLFNSYYQMNKILNAVSYKYSDKLCRYSQKLTESSGIRTCLSMNSHLSLVKVWFSTTNSIKLP